MHNILTHRNEFFICLQIVDIRPYFAFSQLSVLKWVKYGVTQTLLIMLLAYKTGVTFGSLRQGVKHARCFLPVHIILMTPPHPIPAPSPKELCFQVDRLCNTVKHVNYTRINIYDFINIGILRVFNFTNPAILSNKTLIYS